MLIISLLISNESWVHDINALVPLDTLSLINSIPIGNEDKAIWKLSKSGLFTCSTAFKILRSQNVAPPIFNYIWMNEIPFKIFFFYVEAFEKESSSRCLSIQI